MSTLSKALSSLRPGAEWRIEGDEKLENLKWLSTDVQPPTGAEIDAELARLSAVSLWARHQSQAQGALDASDITMIRCVEHGVTVPAEWASYRGALRAIVRAASGDPTQPLPTRPAYPAGT